jgi:small GTP-binding protein
MSPTATEDEKRQDPKHAFKIVVTGPVGAGKTTFISTISEVTTVATEADITDGTATAEKTTTTVGIDFGRITLGEDLALHLFGTPGQQRFDFMWDVVSQGMLGFITLVDCQRPSSFAEGKAMLDHFRALSDAPAIIAANKCDDFRKERQAIVEALDLTEDDFLVPTNALDRESVKQTLVELLELVLANMPEDDPAPKPA